MVMMVVWWMECYVAGMKRKPRLRQKCPNTIPTYVGIVLRNSQTTESALRWSFRPYDSLL